MSPSSLPVRISTDSALSPEYLFSKPRRNRPVLYIDREIITRRYAELKQALPGVDIHYAMKCNPEQLVLEHVKNMGGSFEIASYVELGMLQKIGVNAAEVLYSNPVKSQREIRLAYAAGVRRFAFQSEDELNKFVTVQQDNDKINVYLRLTTPVGESTVESESKFGQPIATVDDRQKALELMQHAANLGLVPYGLAFHVGSQMEHPEAWTCPLKDVAVFMKMLEESGIHLSMLDIGGGFPAYHNANIPPLSEFGKAITRELAQLPYQPNKIAIEPGRALVSDAGAIVAEVYGKAERGGQHWLYLNIGAFNGLMESLETRNELQFPMIDSRGSTRQLNYMVSGPSCDGQDTISTGQLLSADLAYGDQVAIYTTGAYTTAYASHFNGFKPPLVVYVS